LIDQLTKVLLDDNVEGQEEFAGRDARPQGAGLDGDYEDMRFNGIASRRLLEFLWDGEPVQFLIDWMDLVPSIVPDDNEVDAVEEELLVVLDFKRNGVLPRRVFQRLVCRLASVSSRGTPSFPPQLSQHPVLMPFEWAPLDLHRDLDESMIKIFVTSEPGRNDVPRILDIFDEMAYEVGIQFMNKKLKWDLLLVDESRQST